ncbi:MAG: hypothetical protein QXQ53_06880 [Candidatus Methanosuratincola sp.]
MGGRKDSPSRWSPGFGTWKPAAPMSVCTEGKRSLRPEWAERAVYGWKGARPVSLNCSGKGTQGAPGKRRAEGSSIEATGCERNRRPGPERVAGRVSGGRADKSVGEGRAVSPAGRLSGRECQETASIRAEAGSGRKGAVVLPGRLAGRAVAGRERFACPRCWLVGRWAAQPALSPDSAPLRSALQVKRDSLGGNVVSIQSAFQEQWNEQRYTIRRNFPGKN